MGAKVSEVTVPLFGWPRPAASAPLVLRRLPGDDGDCAADWCCFIAFNVVGDGRYFNEYYGDGSQMRLHHQSRLLPKERRVAALNYYSKITAVATAATVGVDGDSCLISDGR